MPFRYQPEPVEGANFVRAGLVRLARRPPRLSRASSRQAVNIPDFTKLQLKQPDTVYQPHPVYRLDIIRVAAGDGISAAQLSRGFFYLIEADGEPCGRAAITSNATGRAELLSGISFGTYAKGAVLALEMLAQNQLLQAGVYEVCALHSLFLYFSALWLKSESLGGDIVVPLPYGTPSGLNALKIYSIDEILSALQPFAKRRMNEGGSAGRV